ncbi:MAG: hypothetical protein H0U75_09520 [Legionella sp.]|nr:hypothetical protein [Legionella sp.]
MDDNCDDTTTLDKKKFNEERIEAWRKQRLASAESAAEERKQKAETERDMRVNAFRRQRQEAVEVLEKEKKAQAIEKLPFFEKINETKQSIVFEQAQRKRLFLKKLAMLLMASFLLTLMLHFVTTPFYEAEAIVTIKTNSVNENKASSSILPTSISPNIMQNIFSAREYIFSREMMHKLEQGEGFITYFKNKDIHLLSRPFSNHITGGDDYAYFKRRVKVAVDIQEGLLRIKVQAKSQNDAKRFSEALLHYAEDWVNNLSNRMYADKITEAKESLNQSERKLQLARKRIVNFQISKRDLNPRETIAALYNNINEIKTKTKEAEREIALYKRAQVNDSPVVDKLKANLVVLKQQQHGLNARLVDKGKWSMNKILSGFESALVERDVAEKEWETSLQSLERIKTEVFNQKQYFLTVVPPITSPQPIEPQLIKLFFLILMVLYVAMSLLTLVKTTMIISMKN